MKNHITVIQLCILLIVKCEIISGPSDFAAGIKEQGILSCIATKQGGNPGQFIIVHCKVISRKSKNSLASYFFTRIFLILRVVQAQTILFLKSSSGSRGSDMERF